MKIIFVSGMEMLHPAVIKYVFALLINLITHAVPHIVYCHDYLTIPCIATIINKKITCWRKVVVWLTLKGSYLICHNYYAISTEYFSVDRSLCVLCLWFSSMILSLNQTNLVVYVPKLIMAFSEWSIDLGGWNKCWWLVF